MSDVRRTEPAGDSDAESASDTDDRQQQQQHDPRHMADTMEAMNRDQLQIILRKVARQTTHSHHHGSAGSSHQRPGSSGETKYAYRGSFAETDKVNAIGVLTSGGDCCG